MSQKTASSADWKTTFAQLENQLDLYLGEKAPALPAEWKEIIVKVAPWLVLILGILSLPAILTILGMGAFLMPFSFLGGISNGIGISFGWVLSLVVLVLNFLAIPGLFKRFKQAWNFLYYGTLIGAVQNLISFNLVGLIIGTLLSLYILFQVKEYYK